ncbi:hypothetical protein L6452_34482 [Arctium lappa]|uniref:Uncharacterized protein n=1 Tax=Arctium lappa TaxID=4217 RepID=A0ACB8YHK5_ARCLA|nr:hypothetical protein L6452_34482 [Arctium lappa]
MAIRSLLTHLRIYCSSREMRTNGVAKRFNFLRGISSNTLSAIPSQPSKDSNNIDLVTQLLFLKHPRRSATSVLQNWDSKGQKVSIYDLRHISKQLVRRGRYKHALEVMKWMEDQEHFKISEADHALRLQLIIKLNPLKEAEDYFAQIPTIASQKASYLHLLNSYVTEKATEKAESLMLKMNTFNANITPHPFNSMMKLYIATSKFELVLSIISQMKQNRIPRNVLSYNLWMSACNEVYGVEHVEKIHEEMVNDTHVKVGWSSLCTLANIYMKSGLIEKATLALRNAEDKLSVNNRFGYFFLITNYASLRNKAGVLRLWESCKRVDGKLTCANYMCMVLSLVKIGDVKEAEKVFVEWESRCRRYDVRVSNILLGAYVRDGLMEKAEKFHVRTLEKGGCPNYKTWEILVEGYVRSQKMEKAIVAMKEMFKMLKHCDWRPSRAMIESILGYFEVNGKLEDAKRYLTVLREFNLASLNVYRTLIRMHVARKEPTDEILEMMEDDKIDMDGETTNLVHDSQA